MAMSGNGAKISGMKITMVRLLMALLGYLAVIKTDAPCVVARGTSAFSIVVQRYAAGALQAIAAATSVFALSCEFAFSREDCFFTLLPFYLYPLCYILSSTPLALFLFFDFGYC